MAERNALLALDVLLEECPLLAWWDILMLLE